MWDHIINIHPSELLSTKIKKSIIDELYKKKMLHNNKKKLTIYIFYLIISLQIFLKSYQNIKMIINSI